MKQVERNSIRTRSLRSRKLVFAICALAFSFSAVSGQVPDTVLFSYKTYGLEIDSINIIQNVSYLDDFYESLYHLKKSPDTVINIIHLGDSHIQADFLTSIIRRNFHKRFGNAGRGLVFPARLAGTNEAFNIVSSSTASWTARRIVQPTPPLPIGISGITIRTNEPGTKLNIYMRDLWLDYSFNKVTLFYDKSDSSFEFIVRDTANNELGKINSLSKEPNNHQQTMLNRAVDAISVEMIKANEFQTHATLFGVLLENSNTGIEYHAIGVNGAKYEQYNKAEYFAKQTPLLMPSLIIISLGTNESQASPSLDKSFLNHVDSLVTRLNNLNPKAKIILTTPQESFRKKVRPNPGSLTIRNEIIAYAVENGYAFWDCYAIMGGAGSANAWRKAGLFRQDGVHLTIQGYEYQGDLLFHALMKGYNNYVSVRHP